jgi:hypothetical protein
MIAASIFLAVVAVTDPASAIAAKPEPLCSLDKATTTPVAGGATTAPAAGADALKGRLGGSRDGFEDRFGKPTDESILFITYETKECDYIVSYKDDILTDVTVFSPGYEDEKAAWTIGGAGEIAKRLLPLDVELKKPHRDVSFVEQQECFSKALAGEVPDDVYAYVDNNPTPGQCSVAYSLDDRDKVLSFTVQLQIEDPN